MNFDATAEKSVAAGVFGESTGMLVCQKVDVTSVAGQLMIPGPVFMDAEAFGVAVSRRQDARESLLAIERTRLLDVLCHARVLLSTGLEDAQAFQVWLVPTDAGDGKPRLVWFKLSKPGDSYLIELNDF